LCGRISARAQARPIKLKEAISMMDYFSPAYIAVAGFFGMLGMGACMYG